MNFEDCFAELRAKKIRIDFDNKDASTPNRLSNEALFLLPLLSVSLLVFAADRRKPRVEELGQLLGECIERTFPTFKGSSQNLGWSANLRIRSIRALTFLEVSRLVKVDERSKRVVATARGKDVVEKALDGDGDLATNLRILRRAYRNLCAERQISLAIK